MFALAFLGISVCVSGEYFIEITPNYEPDYYQMKLGDTVSFKVNAYQKSATSNSLVELKEKVWWEYDLRLLEKVFLDNTSVTLKAKKEGMSGLCATTLVKNQYCRKKISISIIK